MGPGQLYGTFNGRQVGQRNLTAGIWSGTADSFQSLVPPGAFGASAAYATDGVQQVGVVVGEAALWSGTANSYVSLGLPDQSSIAWGVFNGFQCGQAAFLSSGRQLPVVWTSTAQSIEYLPFVTTSIGSFGSGAAYGIWTDATTIYVVGTLNLNQSPGTNIAVLWTRPIPAPGSLAALALAGVVSTCRRRGAV
jgi:hypothetical protein